MLIHFKSFFLYKQLNKIKILDATKIINEKTISNFQKILEAEEEEKNLNYSINLNDFEQKDLIIKEAFNKAYNVVEKKTGIVFSARISNIDMNQISQEDMINISKELKKILNLNHPSILIIFGFSSSNFKKEPNPIFITETTSNKTLADILQIERNNIHFSGWNNIKNLIVIFGIASGTKYLHENDVLNRNLIPSNVLLDDENLYLKLSNFGLCNQLLIQNSVTFQSTRKITRSSKYSAPEVLDSDNYNSKSDVFSFTLIAFEILTNENLQSLIIKGEKNDNCFIILLIRCTLSTFFKYGQFEKSSLTNFFNTFWNHYFI